ncbi:MAG: thiosulfate/3-mercaptopyruvate sulfurtransferase [Candidatus Azotimanducaceae bacterium]|jgi:thiosulfate/3-mercaptopyruvate sulfurtransferase
MQAKNWRPILFKISGAIIAQLINSAVAAQPELTLAKPLDRTLVEQDTTTMDLLVSTEWLSEHLNDPDLIILDCTFLAKRDENGMMYNESGKDTYDQAHIPNAGFADLVQELSDQDNEFELWMPSPIKFTEAMQALGIGNNSRVVLYSRSDPTVAARVWWMLRWIGIDQVAILDGGMAAWKKEGRDVSSKAVSRPKSQITIALRPDLIASQHQVLSAIEDNGVVLLDALPIEHYRGDFALYPRAGHIAGANSMPAMELVHGNYYRSYDELDLMFDDERSKPVITYCGGGVAAASLAFSMHRLGFENVSVYMGSLQEWTSDLTNPMTLDEE